MISQAAPDVEQGLATLTRDLVAALSSDLVGIALYGGLAKGRFTPGISDVNVLVMVRRVDLDLLQRAAGPLTAARRSNRVVALVVAENELQRLAEVFPVKIADIKAAHRVLHGAIPLGSVEIHPRMLVLRVRQQLANMELRARNDAILHANDPANFWPHILQGLPKLAVTLETVLRVPGVGVTPDRPGILRRASELLEVPELMAFADLHRHDARPSDDEIRRLIAIWLALFEKLELAVERLLQ
ncbi:MAG: hypothetical protein WEE89_08535 [Gemmatimonadota bacterium]